MPNNSGEKGVIGVVSPGMKVVSFRPPPPAVIADCRTVEDAPTGLPWSIEDFDAAAAQQFMWLLEAAADERLAVMERVSRDQTRHGVIVVMSRERGDTSVTRALAEFVTGSDDFTMDTLNAFDYLGFHATRNQISLVIHAQSPHSRIAFVCIIRQEDGEYHFEYLARLLVTASEVAQWQISLSEKAGS